MCIRDRRVAEELRVPVGGAVGFQVRFNDAVSEQTAIKFMTDGILLAEIQTDRWLSKYDTLIIDEAHERSLNIDFLLGYLKQLLPRRPDLKLIVTSATIDTERFSAHFGGAPVVRVEGRGYPVEMRYREMGGDHEDAGERTLLDLSLIHIYAIQQCALTGILMVAAHFAIAHLYRIAAPLHTHHWRTTKVCGEALGINRGRGDNQLQVGPTWQ